MADNRAARSISLEQAKVQLSAMVAQVQDGSEITILKDGVPVARLVRHSPIPKRQFGALKGEIGFSEEFFDPLPEDELKAWGEI